MEGHDLRGQVAEFSKFIEVFRDGEYRPQSPEYVAASLPAAVGLLALDLPDEAGQNSRAALRLMRFLLPIENDAWNFGSEVGTELNNRIPQSSPIIGLVLKNQFLLQRLIQLMHRDSQTRPDALALFAKLSTGSPDQVELLMRVPGSTFALLNNVSSTDGPIVGATLLSLMHLFPRFSQERFKLFFHYDFIPQLKVISQSTNDLLSWRDRLLARLALSQIAIYGDASLRRVIFACGGLQEICKQLNSHNQGALWQAMRALHIFLQTIPNGNYRTVIRYNGMSVGCSALLVVSCQLRTFSRVPSSSSSFRQPPQSSASSKDSGQRTARCRSL